ncbi:MAG: hypothetical protein M3Z10_06760 [Gemmatimonadota bacterium]|nr:hypothetical protein [Gemmatimonadota bacterium]
MPSPSSPACTHDLGVGTTVCLRCRQEARDAARARQQMLLTKLGVGAAGLVGMYIVGGSIFNAVRAAARVNAMFDAPAVATASTTADVRPQGEPGIAVPVSVVAAVAPSPTATLTSAPAPTSAAPGAPLAAIKVVERASAPLALVIPEGRTALKDSVLAQRTGDVVIVDFDLMMSRTRRRDKFERIIRETLPAVYGPHADSVLAAIPEGTLVGEGDLLTELPLRGIHIPMGTDYQLVVWPETRPGRDGLLVVRYRAQLVRG